MRTNSFALILFFSLFFCNITLEAQENDSISNKKLKEVEVIAPYQPSVTRSTTPLQTINSESIYKLGIQSLSDAVRHFNGVTLKDYGGIGGLKTVAIRGMGAEHTSVSYDGMMVSNTQSGQVDIGRFSLENLSVISLNIGQSDDIFQTARSLSSVGILALQTNKPDFTNKNYTGSVKMSGGSFGLFSPSFAYAQKLSDKFAISTNGSWKRSDGRYPFKMMNASTEYKAKRKNSEVDAYHLEANLYSDFKNQGKLNLKVYYFDSDRGLPGSVDYQNPYTGEHMWDKNFFTQASYLRSLGQKVEWKSNFKFDYNYTFYQNKNAAEVDKSKYIQNELYWSNAFLYKINKQLSFSLAEDLFYNNLRNDAKNIAYNKNKPERISSLSAAMLQYQTNRLTVTGGLLATYIREKVKSVDTHNYYRKLSPSISVSFAPIASYQGFKLRASYKDIYRVPTFSELYYTRSFSSVSPEKARQLNAGFTLIHSFDNYGKDGLYTTYLGLIADAYYNKVKDKIIVQPSLSFPSTSNLGEVEITGVDVKLYGSTSFNEYSIDASVSYSYMKAIDVTDSKEDVYKNQIIYTPRNSGSGSLSFNNPWVNISYSIILTGERYFWAYNNSKYKMDGYTDHSVSANRNFIIAGYDVGLQATVHNLWNKQYEVVHYYPMPGRAFTVSGILKF